MTQQPASAPQKRRLSTSMRAMLVTVPVVLIVVGLVISMSIASRPTQVVTNPSKPAATVADNSHVLDDAGEDAPTLVEFLDFECEACGALYPYVEDVREYYDGKINYVVRYFPLGGHFNSMNAAIAVEAAAQQGKFEEMFHQMLQSQAEWGEQQTSEAARFRDYAEELGLDMSAYDKAVSDPATEARVQQDLDAGTALGVSGTPTFFLDGKQLTLTNPNDLPNAIEAALDK